MKKPINKCKDKSFVKIPGVSGYLINKKGEIFSENNNLDNLRWVTKKENQNNPISRERRYKAIIDKQGIPIKAFYNGEFVGNFTCLMEAARKFNLHCTLISKQVRGKIDNVNGYKFERL